MQGQTQKKVHVVAPHPLLTGPSGRKPYELNEPFAAWYLDLFLFMDTDTCYDILLQRHPLFTELFFFTELSNCTLLASNY